MHSYESVVGPVKGVYNQSIGVNKPRGHSLLVAERPNFVTILALGESPMYLINTVPPTLLYILMFTVPFNNANQVNWVSLTEMYGFEIMVIVTMKRLKRTSESSVA
jgi:hypothetical protein